MAINKNIELLRKVLTKSYEIVKESHEDPMFITWVNQTERVLIKIFGENSHEVKQFGDLNFCYDGFFEDEDYSNDDLIEFRRYLRIVRETIKTYIEEFEDELKEEQNFNNIEKKVISNNLNKIFISHSSKDAKIVEELIEILELIGIESENIFCTSFGEYGINLGENFLERIKSEFSENVLVLFLLSENFYNSPVCLCEMGATWVLSKLHIPILIPPFKFEQIKGVIPQTQGFKINSNSDLNLFKEKIEKSFIINSPIKPMNWERKRDRIVERINNKINEEKF